jgi:hypothetical protein
MALGKNQIKKTENEKNQRQEKIPHTPTINESDLNRVTLHQIS